MLSLLIVFVALSNAITCHDTEAITGPYFTLSAAITNYTKESSYYNRDNEKITVRGDWYSLEMEEDVHVVITTYDKFTVLDTKLILFEECDSNEVATSEIDENDDYPNCGSMSKLIVQLKANTTYYLLVTGKNSNYFGRYRLIISKAEQTNNNCYQAQRIESFPAVLEGTTASGEEVQLECTPFSPVKGVWYSFIGDGTSIVADTCNTDMTLDVYLAIVKGPASGEKCENMACFKNEDGGCPGGVGDGPARVYFKTEKGQEYLIFVTSTTRQTGTFQLTVRTVMQALPTVCDQAIFVNSFPYQREFPLNDSWTKTNEVCGDKETQTNAAFFVVKGTGSSVTVHTCDSTEGETKIELFNTCSRQTCIQQNSVYCGLHGYIEFSTTEGQDYYIRISCLTEKCNVAVKMEYSSLSNHDRCESASLVTEEVFDQVLISILSNSTHGCEGRPLTSAGRWYKFIGTELLPNKKGYHIYGLDDSGNQVKRIEMHKGCDNYLCYRNLIGEMVIDIKESAIIFIEAGDGMWLQVKILVEDKMEYDTCNDAREITVPYTSIDYNMNGESSLHFCSEGSTSGVWYKFTVESNATVYASTCSSRISFDSYLSVGKGSCAHIECISEVNDTKNCNGGGVLGFNAIESTTYYLFAGSEIPTESGEFEVKLWTEQPAPTSRCATPYEMDMSKRFVRFTTYNKYAYSTSVTLGTKQESKKGTFIHIPEGYVGKFVIMTCATGTQIPTFISTHKSCLAYGDNSDAGVVTLYTDYTNKACGSYGSYMSLELNGEEVLLFVGNANDGDYGYIDVEILNQATKIESSEPVPESSSSEPVPIISSSSERPKSVSSEQPEPPKPEVSSSVLEPNDDNSVPVPWLVIGLLLLILFTVGFVGVIVYISIRKGRNSSAYTNLTELN